MPQLLTLDVMSTKRTPKPKPYYGRALEARRKLLGGLSALDIENRTNGVIYQKLLYRIEGGDKDPLTLDLVQLSALLKALEWTPQEFSEETQLTLPRSFQTPLPEGNAVPDASGALDGVRSVAVYDLVSAGPGGEGGVIVDTLNIPAKWKGQFVAYQVTGDSMAPHIPDQARVVVKVQDYADPGEIIVGYDPDFGTFVKAYAGPDDDGSVRLVSLNPYYPPLRATALRIFGVVKEIRTSPPVINGSQLRRLN